MGHDYVCGIDLGTTNSVIACLKDNKPFPIPVEEGSAILPSVVSLDEASGKILVGRQARNRLLAFPRHTVRSVKRLMGKETPVSMGNRTFSPEEVSSLILRYLVEKAEAFLGSCVTRAVISVPAYFDDAQRRATIRAGELAGIEVLRILNEPTAAALVYDHLADRAASERPYVLVYDLGGGTFDVSIVEIKGHIREVLASCGDTALGGDDFDERLRDHFFRRIKERTGQDMSAAWDLQVRLGDIAERTKVLLSGTPYTRVEEVAVAIVDGAPVQLDLEVGRREFEEMTGDLLARTLEKTREAMKEAHLESDDIGRVILVGGSTRMPAVQDALADLFALPIEHALDPDLCVALGAAVQGGLILGEPLNHILLDVSAHSLGVKTCDACDPASGAPDFFSPIIRRNTRIPVTMGEVYYTVIEDQSRWDVEVFQGESASCSENTLVGSFTFPLAPAPMHSPVTVHFSYDLEGIVHITADQKGTDNRKTVTLDVRGKKPLAMDMPKAFDAPPINYIAQKARRLLQMEGLPREIGERMREALLDYEAVMKGEVEEEKIEASEDRLLVLIEAVEAWQETREQDTEEAP